jgi:hypothetical protein
MLIIMNLILLGAKDKLRSGHITEIYPPDDLSAMIDSHLIVGLDPISYGRPIRFPSKTGRWYYTDSSDCDFIVGACKGGSIKVTCRYSDQYKKVQKDAIASFNNVSSITKTRRVSF